MHVSLCPNPLMRRAPALLGLTCLTLLAFLRPGLSTPAFSAGSRPVQATLLKNQEYVDALLQGIRDARTRIILSCYLFKTNDLPDNLPRRIAEELIRARQRGLRVTVILERSRDPEDSLSRANLETASLLSEKGVTVRFDSPGRTTHSKSVVIDGRFVYLGSHNLTHPALSRNNELSVLLDSPELAREAEAFLHDL